MNEIDLMPEDARCVNETGTNVFVAYDLMYSQMQESYIFIHRWNFVGIVVMYIGVFMHRMGLANLGLYAILIGSATSPWIGLVGWALHHREKYRQRLHLTVTCEGLIVDDVHVKPRSVPIQRQRLVVDYDTILRCSVSRDILPFYPLHTVSVIVTTTLPDDRRSELFTDVLHFGIPSLSEGEKFVDLVRAIMMEHSTTSPVVKQWLGRCRDRRLCENHTPTH
jgi:hypothetical protein